MTRQTNKTSYHGSPLSFINENCSSSKWVYHLLNAQEKVNMLIHSSKKAKYISQVMRWIWPSDKGSVWCALPTWLTLQFSSGLTGQSFCARLTDAFAFISFHDNNAIVSAGLAVAGVALHKILLYGSAKVNLFYRGTWNLFYQLWQWPQLRKTGVRVRESKWKDGNNVSFRIIHLKAK